MSDIKKAAELADKQWKDAEKRYWKFIDKIVECRKNQLFYPQKSDMWYLGFCLGATKGLQEYDPETIIQEINDGIEEGRLNNGE